jgi:hypothetical protein
MTFLKAVFLSRFSVQASREERSFTHPVSLLLSLNFILIASLFILQLLNSNLLFHSEIEFSLGSFLLIAVLIFCVYFIKLFFLGAFAFIIDKQEIVAEYNFTIFLVNHFLGVLLIPEVVFIAYGPKSLANGFIFLGLAFFAAAFFLRVGKGIAAVLERREAVLFYLILYFCTLEILPLLIGVKLLENVIR